MTVTFERMAPGEFRSLTDGQPNGYWIVNGSAGLSGRDTRNVYGIARNGAVLRWIGSLASCKKTITFTIMKKAGE